MLIILVSFRNFSFHFLLKIDKDELLTLWLASQIYELVKDENNAEKALKFVLKEVSNS